MGRLIWCSFPWFAVMNYHVILFLIGRERNKYVDSSLLCNLQLSYDGGKDSNVVFCDSHATIEDSIDVCIPASWILLHSQVRMCWKMNFQTGYYKYLVSYQLVNGSDEKKRNCLKQDNVWCAARILFNCGNLFNCGYIYLLTGVGSALCILLLGKESTGIYLIMDSNRYDQQWQVKYSLFLKDNFVIYWLWNILGT